MMDVLLDDMESKYHRVSAKNESIILPFLEQAFWFGKTDRSDLLFDLTTTNDLKTSFHVYILQKDPKKLFFVSDSFYHFVNQFCCGNIINHLPKKISPKYQENHTLEQFNASFSQSEYEYHQEMIKSIKRPPDINLNDFDRLQLKNEIGRTLLEASIKVGIRNRDYKDKVLIARNLHSLDVPTEQISLAVGLSFEELENL